MTKFENIYIKYYLYFLNDNKWLLWILNIVSFDNFVLSIHKIFNKNVGWANDKILNKKSFIIINTCTVRI